jgi:hypothetical protein
MRASGEWRGEAPGVQRPSQPEQPNDGCLTLIDRFLDFTLVGVPRWNAEWLSRRSPAYQRRVNAYWERQRRNLYLPLILRSCTSARSGRHFLFRVLCREPQHDRLLT